MGKVGWRKWMRGAQVRLLRSNTRSVHPPRNAKCITTDWHWRMLQSHWTLVRRPSGGPLLAPFWPQNRQSLRRHRASRASRTTRNGFEMGVDVRLSKPIGPGSFLSKITHHGAPSQGKGGHDLPPGVTTTAMGGCSTGGQKLGICETSPPGVPSPNVLGQSWRKSPGNGWNRVAA